MSFRAGTGDQSPGSRNAMHTPNPSERVAAMLRIRRFEEECFRLSKAGQLLGRYHVYIGQEAPLTSPL